jgi:hypothetical protein
MEGRREVEREGGGRERGRSREGKIGRETQRERCGGERDKMREVREVDKHRETERGT